MEKQELIRIRAILEVLGKPKEHVEKTIRMLVDKIKETGAPIVGLSGFLAL